MSLIVLWTPGEARRLSAGLSFHFGPCFSSNAICGKTTIILPLFVLPRLVTYHSIEHVSLLCFLLALIGVTLTLSFTPLMAEIAYEVEAKQKAKPGMYGKKGAYV